MSKIITEDKNLYSFKKIPFKDLEFGDIFADTFGKLFMKVKYYNYNYTAVDIVTGEVTPFDVLEGVYPVDCDITYKKILQEVCKNE